MAKAPVWLPVIERILEDVKASPPGLSFGRTDIEQIFGVKRTEAARIMQIAGGGVENGETWIGREPLIAFLENRYERDFKAAKERQERLAAALKKAKAPKLYVPKISFLTRMGALEQRGISLKKGLLLIPFGTAEDLLEKLYLLSRALANETGNLRDFEGDQPGALFDPPVEKKAVESSFVGAPAPATSSMDPGGVCARTVEVRE